MLTLGIIIYVFLTLWLFYASALFVSKRLGFKTLSDKVIALSIIVISEQVFTGWVLGIFGRLFGPELFITNFLISTLLILLSQPRRSDWLEPFRLLGSIFRSWWGLRRQLYIFLFILLDIVLLTLLLIRGLVYPPFGWDDIVYHLGEVGFMLQDGGLGFIPRFPFETYHRNIELTYFWNTVFIRHQIHLNCLQIPYALLAVFSCYGILRKAGCRRYPSTLAALTFPTIPVVIQQLNTAYIDVALSACLLAGINFLAQRKMRLPDVIMAGLAFGVVVGAKGSGGLMVGSIIVVWLIFSGWGIIRQIRMKRFLGWVVLLIIVLLVNGGWVYTRNWVIHGNPVYPYIVKVGSTTIFSGYKSYESLAGRELLGAEYIPIMKRPWLKRMYHVWSEPLSEIAHGSRRAGFGPLFFVLFLPVTAVSIILSLLQRRWRFLLVLMMLTAPLLAIHLLSFWSRYVVFFTAAGMASFAFVLGLLMRSQWRRVLAFLALALALTSSFLFFRIPYVDDGLQGLKHYMGKGPKYWHASQFSTNGLDKYFFRKVYPYQMPGTVTLVDMSFKFFHIMCIWNLDFSNRLVYVHADDEKEWFDELEKARPDYVLVGVEGKAYRWATEHPELFTLLQENNAFKFYRVQHGITSEADAL